MANLNDLALELVALIRVSGFDKSILWMAGFITAVMAIAGPVFYFGPGTGHLIGK